MLKNRLVLDDRAPPSEVVNKVAGIVSQTSNRASNHELYKLLETSDIDRYEKLNVYILCFLVLVDRVCKPLTQA